MGITVLIVTAVSTSYKREASPVDYSKFSFGLVCGILRFCILGESTGNWTISLKSQYSMGHLKMNPSISQTKPYIQH